MIFKYHESGSLERSEQMRKKIQIEQKNRPSFFNFIQNLYISTDQAFLFCRINWLYHTHSWSGEFLGRAGFEPAQTCRQRIYSPSPLTARASTQEGLIIGLFIDNPRSTSFLSTLPTPRGSRIPVFSLKERCPKPLDDGGISARPSSYYDDSMNSFLELSI